MLVLKYLLMIVGLGVFGSAVALVAYDIYMSAQLLRLLRREAKEGSGSTEGAGGSATQPLRAVRWGLARQLVIAAIVPLLLALSIVVIPDGSARVRVSQNGGRAPEHALSRGAHRCAAHRQRGSV